MSEATKGKWSFHPYQNGAPYEIEDEDGGKWTSWTYSIGVRDAVIAQVSARTPNGRGYPSPETQGEALANARRIIASGDLLDACKEALDAFNYPYRKPGARKTIEAAIKSAEEGEV